MFLSNTATAAMMLTFLTPVLKVLPADGKGKIGLAMAIPVAANVAAWELLSAHRPTQLP